MSKEEDWQPGDLALCVKGGHLSGLPIGPYPTVGCLYSVEAVEIYDDWDCRFLRVPGAPNNGSHGPTWAESRFRKIHPHTPDEEDEETIRLLKGEPVFSDDDIGGWIDE